MTSKRQYYYRAILVTIYFANIIFALQQLGDITDNVNTALADTNMLFGIEPPTTPTQKENMARPLQESYTQNAVL